MQKIIAIITLVLALVVINYAIYNKEAVLDNGKVVFLKLAPVDPRSIMQGDYMALRFEMADTLYNNLKNYKENELTEAAFKSADGMVEVQLDQRNIASFVSLSLSTVAWQATNAIKTDQQALLLEEFAAEEQAKALDPSSEKSADKTAQVGELIHLQFRLRDGRVKFATNAYFFEEGSGQKLAAAKYGKFRVSNTGELLLVSLHDIDLVELG